MSAAKAKPRAAVNVDLISIITLYLTIACCRIGLSLSGDVETNDVTRQRRDRRAFSIRRGQDTVD